jgi:arylsulfatase
MKYLACLCRWTRRDLPSAQICTILLTLLLGPSAHAEDRPNILLIVADDLGYSDLGVYGSDIATPTIDALAGRGLLFTQFHTAPMCAPTRAMLLSGNNNHVAGMARQSPAGIVQSRVEGYEAHLSDRIAPLPRVMRDAGYHTYTVGKWHLGTTREHSPWAAGFERSFNLMQGAGNHYDEVGYVEGGSLYMSDGKPVDYPDGRYSTDLYTETLLEFIDSNLSDGKPFFAFAAYTSPHWPLQVPDEDLDLYRGQYDDGYDVLRERRLDSLRQAGIIPASAKLPARYNELPVWNDLSNEQQRREARKMELYAAMVTNLDRHIARLFKYLDDHNLTDNTLIVFMSDNGAAAEDFYNDQTRRFFDYVRANYDNSLPNMGKPNSFVSYGPQWAEAGAAAHRMHKTHTTEGGMIAPMIIAGPDIAHKAAKTSAYTTVMDLMPTFLDLADTEYPDDPNLVPMAGESMLDLLTGERDTVHSDTYVTVLSHRGRSFIRQGDWKLTHAASPFSEAGFSLYNLAQDQIEAVDLSEREPERFQHLLELWRTERKRLGIILPEDL